MSYTTDREKAEDAVQDVFTKLWNKRKDLIIKSSLKNYLYRAAYNQLMDKYRKQKKNDEMLSSYYYTAVMRAIETDPTIKAEKLKKLRECIDLLPKKCKTVFVESKIAGLRHHQISEKLDIAMKTIEGHITRAYGLLRACLNQAM